jgi:hypothetical protein
MLSPGDSSALNSVEIPSLVIVSGEFNFGWCRSLECVRFEGGSQLERIEID